MILRRRLRDGRNLDVDMGPARPHVPKSRGGSTLADARPMVTPGGLDWGNGRRRGKRDKGAVEG